MTLEELAEAYENGYMTAKQELARKRVTRYAILLIVSPYLIVIAAITGLGLLTGFIEGL